MSNSGESGVPPVSVRAGEPGREARAVDVSAFERLKANLGEEAPGLLPELVSEFLQDAADLVGRVDAGLQVGAWREARRVAHTLRSTALAFGAGGLADGCALLEDALAGDPEADHRVLVRRVHQEYARVAEALADLLA